MVEDLQIGELVILPWGLDEIVGRVAEIYGLAPRIQVVVGLEPELSSFVVDEPTTVTMPLSALRRTTVTA